MTLRPCIEVRYCGGCNPEIDRANLVSAVAALMGRAVDFNSGTAPDLVLLVNGCAHACLDEDVEVMNSPHPRVCVRGKRLDSRPVRERDLPQAVVNRIMQTLNISLRDPSGK